MKHSKKYMSAKTKLADKKYESLKEVVEDVKQSSTTKFVSSVDIVVKLNLDTSKSEQQLRGAIVLPHTFGKETIVLAITDDVTGATAAGANFAGGVDMLEKIKGGWLGFDVIVTTPMFMPELGKLGKILGPKGLVPNVKTGNVGPNIVSLVKEFKNGKKKYSTDSFGNVHICVGKVDTPTEGIIDNIKTVIDLLKSVRPTTVKGEYIQKIVLSTTMGPSVVVPSLLIQ